MTHTLSGLDRLATLIVGLFLIAVGGGTAMWAAEAVGGQPKFITAQSLVCATQSAWWPWAATGAGVALVILGVGWLMLHSPPATASDLVLNGRYDTGEFRVELGTVANGIARKLANSNVIDESTGNVVDDRGLLTIDLTVTLGSAADLAATVAVVDDVCEDAAAMIGYVAVATRTHLRIAD
ncbi:hypothetical protein ACNHUS_34605 [Actinomycetes bacterium M1A6_2h]